MVWQQWVLAVLVAVTIVLQAYLGKTKGEIDPIAVALNLVILGLVVSI